MVQALRGDYIGGDFREPTRGAEASSYGSVDPATGMPVAEGVWSAVQSTVAMDAAEIALRAWRARTLSDRWQVLVGFRQSIARNRAGLAEAITLEMGKVRSEAEAEVDALLGRFDHVHAQVTRDLAGGPIPGGTEALYYRPHGVVGVIGPFNFPLHLCHVHVVPALLLGNTVVVKPSEVAPLAAERYAKAAAQAGIPAGVFNLVQGSGAVGAALLHDARLRGLAFTGSWATGRHLRHATLDRPEVLLALEMGGKNTCVVLPDADLSQAAHEVLVGGMLTTGQRCTCTDRVLVHRDVLGPFLDRLCAAINGLAFAPPTMVGAFAGPLATRSARDRFRAVVARGEAGGAECIAAGGLHSSVSPAGFYALPTVHLLPAGRHDIAGYTDTELFGPDLHVEVIDSDEEAFAVLNASPYGFATSVFSADEARFNRYLHEVETGILNWNRSTNQASPRLPFGGLKKSGNHRPAGAFAPRNLTTPVAVQKNPAGVFARAAGLPHDTMPPDLAALARRHEAEEAREGSEHFSLQRGRPRPGCLLRPAGGKLGDSESWLDRLYAGDRVVREKKPPVFDHQRSFGPWLVSIDGAPLSVLDGMSQTATMPAGFSPDSLVRAYVEGAFDEVAMVAEDTARYAAEPWGAGERDRFAVAFADTLRSLAPAFPHVSFTNSGAEACEKALALCHRAHRTRSKVLAFEGGFHGRTLLALAATHNPSKRGPFEFAGFEAKFAPFPVWRTPDLPEPASPAGWEDAVGHAHFDAARALVGEDGLLRAELHALEAVAAALAPADVFAVIVEPMQSEGGDRYATARFHRALRLLTRTFDVPLIMDEVQCGFGLGGTFLWHARFSLRDSSGEPDRPDVVTVAKRAQVGVVLSTMDDPEPTSSHPASLVRGRLVAELMADDPIAGRLEQTLRARLGFLAQRFPQWILWPRVCGYAMAFDLPSAAHLNAYLGQRFWRGVVVFGAGDRTVRYRLSRAFGDEALDVLFASIEESIAWLIAHPGVSDAPSWVNLPEVPRSPGDAGTPASERRVHALAPGSKEAQLQRSRDAALSLSVVDGSVPAQAQVEWLDAVVRLEEAVYEPARRDPRAKLALAFAPDGIAVVAELADPRGTTELVGVALGAPLEHFSDVAGPREDPFLGANNTLYCLAVTVRPDLQGQGLGRRLKLALLHEAERRSAEAAGVGSARVAEAGHVARPRYRHASGRNRVGSADAMMALNRSLGAYEVNTIGNAYDDGGDAVYYRMPIGPFVPPIAAPFSAEGARVPPSMTLRVAAPERDLSQGISRPFATAPPSLRAVEARGGLFGPVVNKLTVMNYVTPAYVRALEWVSALTPFQPHLYLTSSRDETIDKTIRLLRILRPHGQQVLGLSGGYVGHTTAAARSLSDPAVHQQGPAYFTNWPRVPHPAQVGAEETIAALDASLRAAGAAERVIGLFVEPVQERTGAVLSGAFLEALASWRAATNVPVVFVETASACYRSTRGAFFSSEGLFVPDAVLWWGGGQVGFVHVSVALRVGTPMTLVSTWDGDELSLVRVTHQCRAARREPIGPLADLLDDALAPARSAGIAVAGLGLYRTLAAGERSQALLAKLRDAAGVAVRPFPNGVLALSPPFDVDRTAFEGLEAVLAEAFR